MTALAREPGPGAARLASVVIGALVAAGWLMAAASAAALAGSLWWVLDLVASFRPQIAVVMLLPLGVVALLRPLRRLSAAVLTLATLVNAAVLWPYLAGPPPRAEGAAVLDVISYNVGISSAGRDRAMSWVKAQDPDVVFLYESSFEWEDSIARVGIALDVVAEVPPGRLAGITVLAKPGLGARVVDSPFDPAQSVAIRLDPGGGSIDVLGLHPPSPTTPQRAERRDALLAGAGDWVAGRSVPVLVVGDLNATPWSHARRALVRRGGLTDSLEGRGLQPTWPAGWGPLMIPIDHALTGPGLVVTRRGTGPELGSSHLPLLVSVAYQDGG